MKHNKPTFEELSLYYDGLLDAARQVEVQEWLEHDPQSQRVLSAFSLLDRSQQPEMSQDELDGFLDGTLQNIHARIYSEDRMAKYQSTSILNWLSPKVLGSVFALSVTAFALVLAFNATHTVDTPTQDNPQTVIQGVTPLDETPRTEDQAGITEEMQRQALLATARTAKSWIETGMQYAAANRERVTKPLQEFQADANKALALSTLPPVLPRANPDGLPEEETPPSAVQTLAQVGQQQVAIGLGVSLLTLASSL